MSKNEPIWIISTDGDPYLICGVEIEKSPNTYGHSLEALLVNGGRISIDSTGSDNRGYLFPMRDRISEFLLNPKRKDGEILDLRK